MLGKQAASNATLTSRLTFITLSLSLIPSFRYYFTANAAPMAFFFGVNPIWL